MLLTSMIVLGRGAVRQRAAGGGVLARSPRATGRGARAETAGVLPAQRLDHRRPRGGDRSADRRDRGHLQRERRAAASSSRTRRPRPSTTRRRWIERPGEPRMLGDAEQVEMSPTEQHLRTVAGSELFAGFPPRAWPCWPTSRGSCGTSRRSWCSRSATRPAPCCSSRKAPSRSACRWRSAASLGTSRWTRRPRAASSLVRARATVSIHALGRAVTELTLLRVERFALEDLFARSR